MNNENKKRVQTKYQKNWKKNMSIKIKHNNANKNNHIKKTLIIYKHNKIITQRYQHWETK